MHKVYDRSPLWLASAGVLLIVSAFFWYGDIRQMIATYSFSPGTVVDFEQSVLSQGESLKPVIHFLSHKGEMVELILPDNNRGLVEGETVEVMYPASDPFSGDVYSEYILWGGPTLILFAGMVMLLIVFVILAKNALDDEKQEADKGTDMSEELSPLSLNTMFVNVEKNRGAEVDGHLPYCIYTQWRDPITSEVHFFQSQNLWLDPSQYIKRKKVKVFIEQSDLSQYNVDLSFLPEEVVMENRRLSQQYAGKTS